MVASQGGLALHTLALRRGSLAVVQPLVVTAPVFAFLFRAALNRHLPSRALMVWVLLTAAGLAVFLLAAGETTGSERPFEAAAAVFMGAGVAIAATAWQLSRRLGEVRAGLLLGVSAGVVFGLVAGVLKAATDAVARAVPLLSTWPVYGLAGLGCAGVPA